MKTLTNPTELADGVKKHLNKAHRGAFCEIPGLVLFDNHFDKKRTPQELAMVFRWLARNEYEIKGFASGTTGGWVILAENLDKDETEVEAMNNMLWRAWGKVPGEDSKETWWADRSAQQQVAIDAILARPHIPKRLLQTV